MSPVLWTAVGFAGLWISISFLLRALAGKRAREALRAVEGKDIMKISRSADFFGIESRGMGQVRGNGVLILTGEEMYFRMWIPAREIRIPVSSMVEVQTPRFHLGKTRLRPLLKAVFTSDSGARDSCAWLVPDLRDWTAALERLPARGQHARLQPQPPDM